MEKDLIEKALKELNEEGLLNGNKITELGNLEAEKIIKEDERIKDRIFSLFFSLLEKNFYETDFKEFLSEVLYTEKLFKTLNIDFYKKLTTKK